jgi:hypothetical protein
MAEGKGIFEMTDRLERVARALCQVEGVNPDGTYQTGEMETVQPHPGMVTYQPVIAQNWKKFEKDAHRFIAAYEALRESD